MYFTSTFLTNPSRRLASAFTKHAQLPFASYLIVVLDDDYIANLEVSSSSVPFRLNNERREKVSVPSSPETLNDLL